MPKESKVKPSEAAVRTKKSKKDKDAPKRGLSAYMFFSQDRREKVRSDNPEAKFGDIGRILGAQWKEMSDAEKKPYIAMAERDKKRAEDEKAAYTKANGSTKKKSSKKAAKPASEDDEDDD